MTGRGPTCPTHGQPLHNAELCPGCIHHLEQALAEIPAIVDDLETTLTRQGATGQRDGGRSATKPLPFDLTASGLLHELHRLLAGWVNEVRCSSDRLPRDAGTATLARWLQTRLPRLAQYPAATELADDIHRVVERSKWVIDRRPDRWYAGPCLTAGCVEPDVHGRPRPTDLFVQPKAKRVLCRRCGASYDVAERRALLLAAAEDVLATATEIARAVTSLAGVTVRAARVWQWAHRGRLVAHSVDGQGHPLYRVGDVIELLAAEQRKEASRAS